MVDHLLADPSPTHALDQCETRAQAVLVSLLQTSTRLGHLQTVREDHAHGSCVVTRAQRTVERVLRSEVGHGAGKVWKFCVQAGLSPLGSRSQCALSLAYAALAVLRRGGARPCSQEGYARSTAGALHCHWCHGYRECVTRAGSASSQPAVVSVGARHGMGEDIVRS